MVTASSVWSDVARIRARSPLVHNITNYVVMNITANALLAIGASPVMAHAVEEVEEMVGLASALVINIGTLSPPWIESMERAARAARARGVPIVLDPVGAGATALRTRAARRLLADSPPAVLRGNPSEILAVAGAAATTKGGRQRGPGRRRAGPDGYTLLIADVAQTAINPALYQKLSYDTLRDFVPVSLMGTSAQFLTANASVQANTLAELIKLVKGKPGQMRYGSGGIGSVHHLSMEALKTPLGLDIIHVPYKGNGVAIPAMISGEVALVFSALPAIESHLKAGRVKLLAVNTQKRSAQAPNVPTVGEVTGNKDYDYRPRSACSRRRNSLQLSGAT